MILVIILTMPKKPVIPNDPVTWQQAQSATIRQLQTYTNLLLNATEQETVADVCNQIEEDAVFSQARDVCLRDLLRQGYVYRRIASLTNVSMATITRTCK